MRKTFLLLTFISTIAIGQNSNSVYSTANPSNSSRSIVDDLITNDHKYRAQKRENQRQKNQETQSYNSSEERKKVYYTQGERIFIFAGENYDIPLGCINCDKFDSASIWSKYDKHGSIYEKYSIWNQYGDFGGSNGKYSPFNKYSSKPPKLVDLNGNFYGYFTADIYKSNRTTSEFVNMITEKWQLISEDTEKAYIFIFEQ